MTRHTRNALLLLVVASMLVLAACTAPPPPVPVLSPPGPLSVPVNETVDFEVEHLESGVNWSVDGVVGGAPAIGTISDGTYQAPARIPTSSTVVVAAADPIDATRSAEAEVTVTAQGTLYILDEQVYVYNDMGETDGDVAPDRVFAIDGVTTDYFDMTMAPALDMAFISVFKPSSSVFLVEAVSAATGTLEPLNLDTGAAVVLSGLEYDAERDILYVVTEIGLMAFDGASTAVAGQQPDRTMTVPTAPELYSLSDARLRLDAKADRLFLVSPESGIGVFDNASTLDGDVATDRLIELDAPFLYFWGAAYDSTRDELYIGNQDSENGVFVIANASQADGLTAPDRTFSGPSTMLEGPSQLGYDAVNDRLVVIDSFADDVKVFDQASTLDGDVAPTRTIGGTELPLDYPYSGYLDPTQ